MSMTDALEQVKKAASATPAPPPGAMPGVTPNPAERRKRRTKSEILAGTNNINKPPVVIGQGDPAIAEIVKLPFEIWSNTQNLKELKLKNDEALNISKPVKALMDYYLPQVSPVGYVWLSLALMVTNTMSTRLILVSNERAKRKKDNDDNRAEGKREINAGKENTPHEIPVNSI